MNYKTYLENFISQKRKKVDELVEKSDASSDVNEVRSIAEQIKDLQNEIRDAEEILKEETAREEVERDGLPKDARLVNGEVVASFNMRNGEPKDAEKTDLYDTPEYRKAFMEFVCRSTPIPAELRENQVTATTDAGAVIPTTIMNEIVQKMETYGNVYNAVRKLNVQGGVAIPVLSLKPTATWIGEKENSESQKIQANEHITFAYHGVECKIAQTLLVNVTTLEMFQRLFVPLATEAIVKAVEISILSGNGKGKPTGILNDERVPEENVITMSPEEFVSWGAWHKKVKAKMKKAYRTGNFYMNQSTFDGYIDGMEDKNGQPVGRTNYGINGEESYRFMGKDVETVEDDMLPAYEDAKEGDVVAAFFKPTDYAINSNMTMTTVKWTDNDSNEVKNKCIMILDGKLVDPYGVLIIKKGKSQEDGGSTESGTGEPAA